MFSVISPNNSGSALIVAQSIRAGDLCLCEVLRHITHSGATDELVDDFRAALGKLPFRDGKRVSDLLQSLTARAVDLEMDFGNTRLPEGF